MEDVLETYSRDLADDGVPARLGETSRQQTGETRTPLPARPGQVSGTGWILAVGDPASAPGTGLHRLEPHGVDGLPGGAMT